MKRGNNSRWTTLDLIIVGKTKRKLNKYNLVYFYNEPALLLPMLNNILKYKINCIGPEVHNGKGWTISTNLHL